MRITPFIAAALLSSVSACQRPAAEGTHEQSSSFIPAADPLLWDPTWRQGTLANEWWAEFTVAGGGVRTTAVSLQVVGSTTSSTLTWNTDRWAGGVPNVARGTLIVLHATDALGATSQTVPFHFLEDLAPTTDQSSRTPRTNTTCPPLARGLLSITIDDSGPSQPTIAFPLLTKHEVKATFFHVPNFLNWVAEARSFAEQGHETGAHTMTHRTLTQLCAAEVDDELRLSKQWLEANVSSPVESFASPSGAYNASVIAAIKPYFASHRTTEEGVNYVGSDVYELTTTLIQNTSTAEGICAQIAEVAALRGWLILTFHDFTNAATTTARFTVTAEIFDAILACAKNNPGLDVVTQKEGVAAIRCGSPVP